MRKNQEAAYDYARCERVWQKVDPQLNPYPEVRAAMAQENVLALPGAEENPCCMGTEAQASIDVLQGFVYKETADARQYAWLARKAPTQEARRLFCRMADDEQQHAQKLLSVCYLITGERYVPTETAQIRHFDSYCAMLRQLYHEEVCGGFNYRRASEETLDYCLEKIFSEMAQDEYRHADCILHLLGKNLQR